MITSCCFTLVTFNWLLLHILRQQPNHYASTWREGRSPAQTVSYFCTNLWTASESNVVVLLFFTKSSCAFATVRWKTYNILDDNILYCSDTVSIELDRKRTKVSKHSERLQTLKTSVNDLKEEKLDIEKELQERKQLEERKEELEEKNDVLSVDIQVRKLM